MYPIYAEIIEKLYAPQEVAWGTLHLEAFYDVIKFANHLHFRRDMITGIRQNSLLSYNSRPPVP